VLPGNLRGIMLLFQSQGQRHLHVLYSTGFSMSYFGGQAVTLMTSGRRVSRSLISEFCVIYMKPDWSTRLFLAVEGSIRIPRSTYVSLVLETVGLPARPTP
jgi:hypothetical protein